MSRTLNSASSFDTTGARFIASASVAKLHPVPQRMVALRSRQKNTLKGYAGSSERAAAPSSRCTFADFNRKVVPT